MSVTAPILPMVVDTPTVAPPVIRLLEYASFNWMVIAEVLVPFATMDVGSAVTVEVAVEAAPGFTVKLPEALEVLVVPSLAVMERLPTPADVGVMVMPSTSPPVVMFAGTVPVYALEPRFTVPVYPVTVLPFESCAVTRTWNGVPAVLATAERSVVPPLMVTANFAIGPATKFTVAVFVIGEPFNVALTVDVAVCGGHDVSVAEYVPFPLSVVPPTLPALAPMLTVPPELVRLLPFESFNCTVIADVLVPFAVIEVGFADTVDVDVDAGPGVTVNVPLVADRSGSPEVAVAVSETPDSAFV